MEGVEGTSIILSDLQTGGPLLLFCSAADQQHEQDQEQLTGTLEAASVSESEDPLWVVGDTIQLSLHDGQADGASIFGEAHILTEEDGTDTLIQNVQVLTEADGDKTLLGNAQVLQDSSVQSEQQDSEPLLLLDETSQLIPVPSDIPSPDPPVIQSSKNYQPDLLIKNTACELKKVNYAAEYVSVPVQQESHTSVPVRLKLSACSKSSIDEDDPCEESFVGPSLRWPTQPRSYRGAKQREGAAARKNFRKVPQRIDTDGETSGMGSSVDEPVESSTESASEAPALTPPFVPPRGSASRCPSASPTAIKKRRGGWPKGRKRKPEVPGPGAKPPKAPLTAYVLFLNERRKYYKEMLPDLSFGAVTKLLGAEWSSMTAEQKAAFISRSEQEKRRYRNELQAYRQSHDYQLLLRKKRMKNVIKKGGTTTEESSDFTDEIDDDESEELYCRICDQLFTSLHNKRGHLYGKQHLQAITGEYQRERLAEEERQKAAAAGRSGDCSNCGCTVSSQTRCSRPGVKHLPPGVCPMCSSEDSRSILTHIKQSPPAHNEEDDHDGDEEDEEEEEEEEEEEDDDAAEERDEQIGPNCGMSSMADALEGVMAKMLEREQEIKSLKQSSEIARSHNLQLATTLLQLREQKLELYKQQEELQNENDQLKSEADMLWMLPAVFGVTPLDMVNITLRHDNQQSEEDSILEVT
ncbi:uncharacterized protein [Macrobrachium rosenbergii]|uniref:uncharacterized protein n=1 Tax=Macrobrachium rosenbergii TaxID=79674 RepID=UPI0034D3CE60